MSTWPDFEARIADETKGMSPERYAQYLARHVAHGIIAMRAAAGAEHTRQFVLSVLGAVSVPQEQEPTK